MARTATKQTLQDAAHPALPRPRSKPPGGKRRSEAEMEAILGEVESLLDYGVSLTGLCKAMPNIPRRTLAEYMARAAARLEEETAERRHHRRAHALRRHYSRLRQLAIERDPPAPNPKPDHRAKAAIDHAIERIEYQIARLEGTFAPEVLKVVRKTSWEDLTDEQLEEFQRTGIPPAGVSAEDLMRLH